MERRKERVNVQRGSQLTSLFAELLMLQYSEVMSHESINQSHADAFLHLPDTERLLSCLADMSNLRETHEHITSQLCT